MPLTYTNYLKLDELLNLQEYQSEGKEHDEMLFIIVHQVYELWFKQMLHELEQVKEHWSGDHLFRSISTWKRLRTIMKTLVGQLDILETMNSMSFFTFRSAVETASGFQSWQFRAFEFTLGYKRPEVLDQFDDPMWREKLTRYLQRPSIVDCFYDFLEGRGVEIPPELREKDPEAPNVESEALQEGLIEVYRTLPDMRILLELMTDFDQGLQEWRYRHVKMAERTIGAKWGTGGTPGVEFLKQTLFKAVFPDLWSIRHQL